MCRFIGLLVFSVVFGGGFVQSTPASAAEVSLEVLTTEQTPITASREWIEVLKDVGATGIRFRRVVGREALEVRQGGTAARPSYTIVGMLDSRGNLKLPGSSFTKRNKAGIKEYLARVATGQDKPAGPQAAGAFGLTGEELVALHESLGQGVLTTSTKGLGTRDVVTTIAEVTTVPLSLSNSARTLLGGDEKVLDELKGLTAGTALAAVVRPLGLVVVPQKAGGRIGLSVVDVRAAEQSWPIGWPLQKKPREAMPKLYEFLEVEIEDVPLADAINAIVGRLGTAALYDHNGLARKRIDITAAVSLPPGRTYYKRIVDKLASQLRVTTSLRIDEAGKPFLWIEPIGR